MTGSTPILGSFPQAVPPFSGGGWQLNSIKAHAHLLLNSVSSIALFRAGAEIPALESMPALWAAPSLLLSPLDEGTQTQNRKSSFGHTTPLDIQPTHGPTRRCHTHQIKSHRWFLQSQLLGGGDSCPLPRGCRSYPVTPFGFLEDVCVHSVAPQARASQVHLAGCSRSIIPLLQPQLSRSPHAHNSCWRSISLVSRRNQASPHAQNPTATPSL